MADDVLERFLRYVRVWTTSDPASPTSPSTERQRDLSSMLVSELLALGLSDAVLDADGYVYATLAASPGIGEGTVVGLIAHVDTSPEVSGEGVEPLVHRGYDGSPISLPRGGVVVDSPKLLAKAGEDIVTASGDTLLGADDKAGVAEIMAAVAWLVAHPELPRPTLRIGFTPDEEIGRGASRFDVEGFGARAAYTLDGSTIGELQDETFTGAQVVLTIEGYEVHPGFADGVMVNAIKLAGLILAALPESGWAPETTSGRDGFVHPYEITGGTGKATITFIARDFEEDLLREHCERLQAIAEGIVGREPRATLTVDVTPQYPNMRDAVAPFPEIVAHAEAAIRAEGIEPLRNPIRGGTDGSLLSSMGLPCPNVFAGGHEFHSPREWVSVQDMAAAAAVVVRLAGEWALAS